MTERDVQHHIVRSTGTRGEFETLSGRRVTITGSEIIAGQGFPQKITARVIGSDRIKFAPAKPPPVQDGEQAKDLFLSVYFLSRPLDGGVEAPSSVDDLEHSDVMKTIAMIRASPETEVVFDTLQDTIALARMDIQSISLGEDVPPVDEMLKTQVEAAADAFMRSSLFQGVGDNSFNAGTSGSGRDLTGEGARKRSKQHLLQVLESWCMEQLHDELLPAMGATVAFRGDVEKLRAVFRALSKWSMADFKIKPSFRCNLSPAVATLGLLASAATPLEKLHCLRDTCATLQRCVERHLEAAGTDLADVEYATDDILDMLLWVLVTAEAEHASSALPVHLAYIARFHIAAESELVTSRLGYYLANFEQATGYFLVNAHDLLAQAATPPSSAAAATSS